MRKLSFLLLGVLCLLLAPLRATAQQQEPPVFTYVAQWAVPRAQWDALSADFEKTTRPVLERLTADGTLLGWGRFETVVHLPGEATHGVWWQASSIAAIEKTRSELIKLPPNPGFLAATMHRDYLFRSLTHKARPTASAASGYLWVGSSMVKPGKGGEWRDLWDKYNKPVYDELFANGTLTYFGVDVEQVHTQDPGLRFIVYITPTADGIDNVGAAFVARNQKRSEEERRAIGNAFAEVVVPGAHRDLMARVQSYAHK